MKHYQWAKIQTIFKIGVDSLTYSSDLKRDKCVSQVRQPVFLISLKISRCDIILSSQKVTNVTSHNDSLYLLCIMNKQILKFIAQNHHGHLTTLNY